jgi:dipeptidyl aminopeptidase/acylaminoacyl peptidase
LIEEDVIMTGCSWKPVVFENQGERLLGILHEPDSGNKRPCPGIVMCHGFAGQKIEPHRIFVKMARALSSCGFYVLRFDFRGSGDSDGDFSGATISGEISDALQAVEYLSGSEGVARESIGLLGLSLGGTIAACVSWRDLRIKAAALWSPVADIPGVFKANLEPEKMEKLAQTGSYDYDGDVVGMGFIRELEKFNPVEEIRKFKGQVLIIHGDNDELVPISNSRQIHDALKERSKFIIIRGAGHTFDSDDLEKQVVESTRDWFKGVLA